MNRQHNEQDEIRDLNVTASESDDVKGGRPMDDEIEFVGDVENPSPRGPGSAGFGGFVVDAAGMAQEAMADPSVLFKTVSGQPRTLGA